MSTFLSLSGFDDDEDDEEDDDDDDEEDDGNVPNIATDQPERSPETYNRLFPVSPSHTGV